MAKPLRSWIKIAAAAWTVTFALIAVCPKLMFIYMPLMAVAWLLSGAILVKWLRAS